MRRHLYIFGILWFLVAFFGLSSALAEPQITTCADTPASGEVTEVTLSIEGSSSIGQVTVKLPLPQGDLVLELVPNTEVLAPEVRERFEAELAQHAQGVPTECLLRGVAYRNGTPVGPTSLSLCGGQHEAVVGVVTVGGATYWLDRDQQRPGIQLLRTVGEEGEIPPAMAALSASGTRFIELVIVNDSSRLRQLEGRLDAVVSHTAELANLVDGLYSTAPFGIPLRVKLVKQVNLSSHDPYTVHAHQLNPGEVDANHLLRQFSNWIGSTENPVTFDAAVLLSGHDLAGDIIGIAYVGMMCAVRPAPHFFSSSVVQSRSVASSFLAATVAHELGHTLGSFHDGEQNSCVSSGHIMSPSLGLIAPTQFSSCSVASINSFLAGSDVTCLDDMPQMNGTCGDGVVEGGEQCDCGLPDCSLVDPCCDGSTCTLTSGARCSSSDGCCNPSTCQPAAAGTLCRSVGSQCDVPEVCDGESGLCPSDRKVVDGALCSDSRGFEGSCFRGTCESLDALCAQFGEQFGEMWLGCSTGTPSCGSARCLPFGADTCLTVVTQQGQDIPLPEGMECAAQHHCTQGSCVPDALCAALPCVNGVCGVRDGGAVCSCEPGWTGPACDININDCASGLCVNGSCIDRVNSYTCSCLPGWRGIHCDRPVASLDVLSSAPVDFANTDRQLLREISRIDSQKEAARRPLRGSKRQRRTTLRARRTILQSMGEMITILGGLPYVTRELEPILHPQTVIDARTFFRRAVRRRGRSTRKGPWRKFERRIWVVEEAVL